MGLLKKLQAENPDDNTGEALGDSADLPPEVEASSKAPANGSGERRFHRTGKPQDAAVEPELVSPDPGMGTVKPTPQATNTDAPKSERAETGTEPELDHEDDLPPQLYMLRELLRSHDWAHEQSSDPSVQANGKVEWTIIESQILSAIDAGYESDVRKLWNQFAPKEHNGLAALLESAREALPGGGGAYQFADLTPFKEPETQLPEAYLNFYDPNKENGPTVIDGEAYVVHDQAVARSATEPFTDPYKGPAWATRPQPAPASESEAQEQKKKEQATQGQGGGMSTDLLSKALSAPFAITAAAGSLVVNSLKAMGDKAKSFYVKNRINGHEILGKQLDQKAFEIESLTNTLRQQGMGDLINDMRATGRPAREIFEGMRPGGAHQHFDDRFNSLMKDPEFSANYAKLQSAMDDFSLSAVKYAQNGLDLNLDYSAAIDRNLEKISAASEGFVFKKDGVVKHLQELARQIGEHISNFVNNLMGRMAPR
ncbi:hypothetical protein [Chromobacterium haemolyticum]|uniref:hypothetical protein n=1 Tax=Chromobacterium haemolyticum TaxID=394935 RepID=UPI00244C1279|nr:hypothetical protein [Chromobacterium haemolyticum]MDH0342154.1 hypothetical protein [Chromobacterium haemolyticum]